MEDQDQSVSTLELSTDTLSQRVMDHENTYSTLRDENKRLKYKVIELAKAVKTYVF